ncbi:MAG TPA: hypothetical protein VGP22_09465 [Albitalea sp.]|jgi:hypothetical protein|nr:hypothetical protein [Albitalea sp.]
MLQLTRDLPRRRQWAREMEDNTRPAYGQGDDRGFLDDWREQPAMVVSVAALLLMLLWWLFG